jgi:gliding motility-associated protein GldM
MSLPKEPRQKMVNIMYLVLTALLALNVSSEILNAFKTVDRSLQNANKIVDQKDKDIFSSFKALMAKTETKDKAIIWNQKAEQAQKMSDQMTADIEALKQELKKEAGLGTMGKSEKGEDLYKEDDLEAATRLFGKSSEHGVGKGKGEYLKNKLQEFKDKLLTSIDPAIKTELVNSLPIDMSTPENKDWTDLYFHMTPTVAALTILSKFENDVKNSAAQVIEYCHKQVGQVEVIYDQFQAIASQSSQYLMPGQELIITGGVGAFNSKAQPSVSIDGANVAINAEGVGEYKTVVSSPGAYSKKVTISFTKPDGTKGSVDKEIKYTVGSPTGVNVSATKVNVLYRGLKNPVAITGGSKGAEAINATCDNGSMSKADNAGNFIVEPGSGNMANINVTVDGKSTSFKFPVKRIPDPTPKIGPLGGGTMSAVSFKAQAGIRADMGDFVFEGVKFNVSKYTIICTGRGFENTGPKYKTVDGAYFDADVKSFVEMCKAGSSVLIQDIWVEGPDGRRKLEGTMGFSLTN